MLASRVRRAGRLLTGIAWSLRDGFLFYAWALDADRRMRRTLKRLSDAW